MQQLGSPVEQLFAYVILGMTAISLWLLDKEFEKQTKLEIVPPDKIDAATKNRRKSKARSYVIGWWVITILQSALAGLGGYLIFRLYGAITLFLLFLMVRVNAGIFGSNAYIDPLASFEKHLRIKSANMSLSPAILKMELEQQMQEGRLASENLDEILLHLSKRDDDIGESAKSLSNEGVL